MTYLKNALLVVTIVLTLLLNSVCFAEFRECEPAIARIFNERQIASTTREEIEEVGGKDCQSNKEHLY